MTSHLFGQWFKELRFAVRMASKTEKVWCHILQIACFVRIYLLNCQEFYSFCWGRFLPYSKLYPVISFYTLRDSFHKEVKDALLILICSLQHSLIKFTLSPKPTPSYPLCYSNIVEIINTQTLPCIFHLPDYVHGHNQSV